MLSNRFLCEVQEAWYLAQLKPGGFERAVTNLERQGFESLMPLREEAHRRAGRWHTILKPLFPGYLFVKVPHDRREWRSINSTYGVSRLVALERGCPTPVPPMIVEGLQNRISANGILQPPSDLAPGDQVKVIAGPFSDMLAEIEGVSEQGRVYVLLDLMGRLARAELATVNVEAV